MFLISGKFSDRQHGRWDILETNVKRGKPQRISSWNAEDLHNWMISVAYPHPLD
jgi:hypothetical protein